MRIMFLKTESAFCLCVTCVMCDTLNYITIKLKKPLFLYIGKYIF